MTADRTGQHRFNEDGEVHVEPSPLTEEGAAWTGGEKQGGLDQWADETNRARMFDIVKWFYNEAPMESWGSRERMAGWMHRQRGDSV